MNGFAPTDEQDVEVIISDFEFIPLEEPTGIGGTTALPDSKAILFHIFPNPAANQTIKLQFGLMEHQMVRLEIFNGEGKLVETLINKQLPDGGTSVPMGCNITAGGHLPLFAYHQ